MKTKSFFFAMLIALSSTALAFGADRPELTVVASKGSQVFKVIYKGETTGNVKLKVLDSQGQMLHTEVIKALNGFIVPVNFKGLSSGTYSIEVVDDSGKYRKEVEYLPGYDSKSIHVSQVQNEVQKYVLAIANAQNEPIRIRIFDRNDRIVFEDRKVIDGDFAQVFKITQGYSRYTFEVSDARGNKKHFSF